MTEARIIPIDGPAKKARTAAKAKSTTGASAKGAIPGAASSKAAPPKAASRTGASSTKPIRATKRALSVDLLESGELVESDESLGFDDATSESPTSSEAGNSWDARLASALAFARRRIAGDFEVDEFGFDPELSDKVLLAALRPLYKHWFRIETIGLENVPAEGGALVVANHSGTVAVDSVMTQLALLDHHPQRRTLRMLGANLVFSTPVISEFARKTGSTVACNADAERLLGNGEVVGVWPEGFKGVGKPFSERYKLQRFGRGGFVAAALRAKVPIIPVSIVGAEEIYPMIGNLKFLARVLGVPYVPVTPTFPWLGPLGLVPLPSKWIIEFGEPIPTDHYPDGAADDPMLVFNLTDQVRETIQHTLYRLLMQRRSVFF